MLISNQNTNSVYVPDGSCTDTVVSTPNCNTNAIYIPEAPCDDCGDLRSDVKELQDSVAVLVTKMTAIEALIGNKQNTVIAMTDTNNNEVSVTVLAE